MNFIRTFLLILPMVFSTIYGMDDFLYSHGFGSTSVKAQRYVWQGIIPATAVGVNFQDARFRIAMRGVGKGLNTWDSCLGQEGDIKKLVSVINSTQNKVVLYGESRGSSAIINTLASGQIEADKVKGVVLDSPFDCIRNVIEHRLAQRTWVNKFVTVENIEGCLAYVLRKYKADGIQPINTVSNIPSQIPILFICSREDKDVPYTSSVALYKKLRSTGHDNVYILILDHGRHGWIMEGKCADTYRNVVHAFYQRYGIEHNPAYAAAGKSLLDTCQPAL